MKTRTGFSLAVFATAILLLCQLTSPALAQDYPPDQGSNQGYEQDPPARAGRISYTEGSVSFQPGGQGDWLDAVRNRPLTVGDNLWVDKGSRAEIQIGGTSIRLGPETSVTFLDLGNNITQLRLSLGSMFFRVRHFERDDTFEVDTPNLAFNVNQAGEYRLDTNQNGDQTIATVFRGEGEITGNGNSYRLNQGQEGTFSGTDQLSYDVAGIRESDSFTRWCLSRDQREDRVRSREYVSEDMTGYEDLDDYGRWRSVPEYGYVWSPAGVPGDWAPYRYGHWAYVYPWGWTWVEDEPWGFAPFHYGRWAYVEDSWCWVPGPVAVRPVYAPALVAFVGGITIAVGSEPVGWFPLAPREVYVPWYHTSPRYVQNVNITNTSVTNVQVTNVYNNYTVNHVNNVTYVNQRVNNSVTVVNHETFVNAQPVHNNIVRVDQRQLASARVTPAAVTRVQPARQSVMGVAHPVQYHPPEQALTRPVVATRQPVAISRPMPNAPAFARPAPAPVRTVRAAPPAQAQPLQQGARGGPPNNGGGRPAQPAQPNADNRGAAARPGEPAGQPNAPENHGAVPRPGTPAAQPTAPEYRGGAPRPGAPAQPNAPENRGQAQRPTSPMNSPEYGRPGAENNRNVPRPGAPVNTAPPPGRPSEIAPRPAAPENRPAPQQNRIPPPDNNRSGVPRPQSSAPQYQAPEQPQPRQYPGTRPESNRPESSPYSPPSRPAQAPQPRPEPMTRPQETPRSMPEQPARPPESRQQPAPRQPESRPQPAPMQSERSAPRPEARAATPPPQRENQPAPRNNNQQRQNEPPKSR